MIMVVTSNSLQVEPGGVMEEMLSYQVGRPVNHQVSLEMIFLVIHQC